MPPLTRRRVLCYVPNLVGDARLLLCALLPVFHLKAYYRLTLGVAACQLALDWADGAFARKLGQVSRLGAWLDVTADLLCRGWLWSAALHGPLSFLPALWETLVFACTHAHSEASSQWKDALAKAPTLPWWARRVMAKGFRSPWGVCAMAGLFLSPVFAYCHAYLPGTLLASWWFGAPVLAGRGLVLAVEVSVVLHHLNALLAMDVADAGGDK